MTRNTAPTYKHVTASYVVRMWKTSGNLEPLPFVQSGFRKVRGTRDQIANIRWIIEKAREFQKNIYFYAKAFVWITTNWKFLKEMGIADHLTCFLRNLYADQEGNS